MSTKNIIVTRRLRLRTWRRSDWKAYHANCNTEEVMRWLGGAVTPRQVQREVDWNRRHQDRYTFGFWIVERKRDAELVGFCGLIRVGELTSPICGELEIGWRVRADMWRCGYALEAARSVMRWASVNLPGEPIYARINVQNKASAALAEKLGMHRVRDGDHIHPLDGMHLALFANRPDQPAP